MFYKNKILSFTDEDFESFSVNLPQEWWHEKDRIVYFTYYSDGSYFCEREKFYYDYALKSEVPRVYEYNSLDEEKAKELFLSFTSFFEDRRILELKEQKEYLREEIQKNFDLISVKYRSQRDSLLRDSDWVLLSDNASQRSDEELVLWRQYRQYLRDMPQSDAWTNKNYINIVYPINPSKFLELFPGEEYLTLPNHFISLSTLSAKESVYRIIKTLKVPSVDSNIGGQIDEVTNHDEISVFIDMINEKLSTIDPGLRIEINVVSSDM